MKRIFAAVIDVFRAVYYILVVYLTCSSIQFMFYLCIFLFILLFTSLLEPPYSGILAIITTAFLHKYDWFGHVEKQLISDNISRTLLLIAHVAAGVLVGRVLSVIFFPSSVVFEVACAGIFGYTNTYYYFKRHRINLKDCFSRTFSNP